MLAVLVAPMRQYCCDAGRSEEHTSELQSHSDLVCRLLLEKKNKSAQVAKVVKIGANKTINGRLVLLIGTNNNINVGKMLMIGEAKIGIDAKTSIVCTNKNS